jgi:hypothetical protein
VSAIVFRGIRRFLASAFAPTFAVVVGACSNVPTLYDLAPQAPKFEFKTLPPTRAFRTLGPPSLIGPDGSCSAPAGEPEFTGAGIALEMSECEVVQRIGPPANIEASANQRGERTVVLTYAGGERAGIYRFVSGRLVGIERGAEPPAPERPAKKKPAKKSAGTAAQ